MRLRGKLGASLIAITSVFGAVGALHPLEAQAQEQATRSFDIPPGDLTRALQAFAEQSDRNVLFTPDMVAGKTSPGVQGQMTERQALEALLAGTGLHFEQTASNGYAVQDPSSPTQLGAAEAAPGYADDEEEIVVTGTLLHNQAPVGAQVVVLDREEIDRSGYSTVQDVVRSLPQSFSGGVGEDTLGGPEGNTNTSKATAINLRGLGAGATLVLVDGRRLAPGGLEGRFTDVSSIPLSAVERIEVLPDGASSLYGSDAIAGVVNVILRDDFEGAETYLRYGGTTDGPLRETLISQSFGWRWTSGNALAAIEYYDRTALPASSREQASSDLTPFGGSNLNTNRCNPGTIRVSGVTYALPEGQNGVGLTPADFVAGTQNTCELLNGRQLLSEQTRVNLVGRIRQDVSPDAELFADLLLGTREIHFESSNKLTLSVPNTNAFYVNPTGGTGTVTVLYDGLEALGPNTNDDTVDSLNLTIGSDLSIGSWNARLQVGTAIQREDQLQRFVDTTALNAALADSNPATAFNPFADGVNTNPATLAGIRGGRRSRFLGDSQVSFSSAVLDGPVFELPAGSVNVAIGGEFRREQFDPESVLGTFSYERDISAIFGEVAIPILSAERGSAVGYLDLSISGRYEDYSDFGTTSVPRFGVQWAPIESLRLRATWAQAYKAPRLAQLDESANFSLVLDVTNPAAPGGVTPALVWFGQSADLVPETADTWTVGFDLEPDAIPGLRLSATYFSIEYTDRIETPADFNGAYIDPSFIGVVDNTPTGARQTDICSRTIFSGNFSSVPADCDTAAIDAIVDVRALNIAQLTQTGVDFGVFYDRLIDIGDISLGVSGTWLSEYSRAVRPGAPSIDDLNTQENPIDLRLRASAALTTAHWDISTFVNYSDSYTDRISVPSRSISSWTTVDFTVGYYFGDSDQGSRPSISLSVENAFDEPPPFYNNATSFVGYDTSNADLLGRVVRVSVRHPW